MKLKLLITGVEGFAGSYLAQWGLEQGAVVHGTVYPRASLRNIEAIKGLHTHPVDILEADRLAELVKAIKPDYIFHLAGQSNVFASNELADQTLKTNVMGNFNIIEAVRKSAIKARVLIVGSANEYGKVPKKEHPINEQQPLNPDNPYAVSKVCQELMGHYYAKQHNLDIVTVRPFNYIGPRQALGFVCSDFAHQLVQIERKEKPPLMEVGNLNVYRDFTDVRDMVRGYWLALAKGKKGGLYNLCSGQYYSIKSLLNSMIAMTGCKVEIKIKAGMIRSNENRCFYGDCTKFQNITKWKAQIPIEETLRDILDYWRGVNRS